MVFSRAFSRMNLTQLELVRADVPRATREDARRAQYVELERQAHRLGTGEQRLDAARDTVAKLPAHPRPGNRDYKRDKCRQAIQMHHREGREFLAAELLKHQRDGE
jgi:hypothetical protein